MNHVKTIAALMLLASLTACSSVGPRSISMDRFDYGEAIGEAVSEQLLSNIVGLRYMETPMFLEVASVINTYSVEGELSGGLGWGTAFTGGDTQTLGARGKWADRPTITYAPVSGQDFARSLMTPMQPESLLALVQSGWPVDLIFGLTFRSINNLNGDRVGLTSRQADPEFTHLMEAWSRLRDAGALGMRIQKRKDGSDLIVFHPQVQLTPQLKEDMKRVHDLLGLDPKISQYRLIYGRVPDQPNEIAAITRSIFDIMLHLAFQFEVPREHIEAGRTAPTFVSENKLVPVVDVRYATSRPDEAYVAVQRGEHWYYIDDRDLMSKRTFAFLQILLSLTDAGEGARGPIVSITG
jgi:hypothetical protein